MNYVELDIDVDFILNKLNKVSTDVFLSSKKSKGVRIFWIDEHKEDFLDIIKFTDNLSKVLNCNIARSCYTTQFNIDSHIPTHIDFDDTKINEPIHGEVYSFIVPCKGSGITTFYNLSSEDKGPNETKWSDRHGVIYDPFNDVSKKLTINEQIEIKKPTILRTSYPHSVIVTKSPRITFQVKLLGCKDGLDVIADKISKYTQS